MARWSTSGSHRLHAICFSTMSLSRVARLEGASYGQLKRRLLCETAARRSTTVSVHVPSYCGTVRDAFRGDAAGCVSHGARCQGAKWPSFCAFAPAFENVVSHSRPSLLPMCNAIGNSVGICG